MYIEGDVPVVTTGNYGNNSGFGFGGGWEGLIGLIAVAALFGNGGFGFGGGYGGVRGSGSEVLGYELGKVATTNDIASGFNNSAVLGSLNDIKLGQSQMQNFINQGFSGINTSLLTGFHGVDNAICTLGYQTQTGFNALSREIGDCCCKTNLAIQDLKYSNERQTCDIISAINAGNQRLVDIYTTDKINALTAENVALKGRISNDAQSAYIISALAPKQPIPAYPVFPTTSFAYPSGVTFGVGNNIGCGCCN
jgi:hypothetical protein